jgi:hypothetical protein
MDIEEEKKDQIDDDSPDKLEKSTEFVQPENDFMAGAMLANGIVFVWMQALSIYRQTATQIPSRVLVDVSYIIYVFAGYISTRQVTKRSKKEHLKAGLKTAGYSSIMGLLIISTMTSEPGMGLAITLAVCYFAGSILGSYMELRARLNSLRSEASP